MATRLTVVVTISGMSGLGCATVPEPPVPPVVIRSLESRPQDRAVLYVGRCNGEDISVRVEAKTTCRRRSWLRGADRAVPMASLNPSGAGYSSVRDKIRRICPVTVQTSLSWPFCTRLATASRNSGSLRSISTANSGLLNIMALTLSRRAQSRGSTSAITGAASIAAIGTNGLTNAKSAYQGLMQTGGSSGRHASPTRIRPVPPPRWRPCACRGSGRPALRRRPCCSPRSGRPLRSGRSR